MAKGFMGYHRKMPINKLILFGNNEYFELD